jgi:hypothetical protein
MTTYTDQMKEAAWRIYERSLDFPAEHRHWKRVDAVKALPTADQYYVKAYLHQYMMEAEKRRKAEDTKNWNPYPRHD